MMSSLKTSRVIRTIFSNIASVLEAASSTIIAPWPSLYEAIRSILNAPDDEKDKLTRRWRDAKLVELRFIGMEVGLDGRSRRTWLTHLSFYRVLSLLQL